MLASLLLLPAVVAFQAQDPVRVSATLTPAAVQAGETAVLEVTIETRGPSPDAITMPPLPSGLEVLGSSDFTQLQLSLPGGRRRTVRRQITLVARTPGTYEIPPVAVRVAGDEYRTQALTLVVSGSASARPRASGPNDEVILRAWLVPDTAYVGQQVTLRGEVLFASVLRMQLRRAPDYIPPTPSGFWVHDLSASPTVQPRNVGGELYEAQTFERAYFPLAPGEYVLDPVRLQYDVRRGFLFAPESHELTTDSLRLVVRPLPEEGRPASFAGAVGRYRIRARIEPREVPAGEAAALVLEVEGEGNIKALPPPALPPIEHARVFSPSEEAEIEARGGVLRGVKRFTWVLVPERPGRLQLPPLEYAYFDPELGEYDVARASVPALEVAAGVAGVAAAGRGATLAVIRAAPAGPPPLRWVRSPWFAAVPFLPLAAIGLALARRRRARLGAAPSRRKLRVQRQERFAALQAIVADDAAAFLARLAEAIRCSLADLFGLREFERAAPAEVRRLLEDCGVGSGLAGDLSRLLERVEAARFEPRPPGPEARRAFLAEAERLLDVVDRDPRGGPRAAGATAGILVLAALAAALPGRLEAAQAPPDGDDFSAAVRAYAAGDFEAAAAGFRRFIEASPEDANAWYNLGNAYFGAGDRGRAIWAWLRAAQLRPRDRDARANLSVAQAGRELVQRALPPVPLSSDELVLFACLSWLLGCALLGRGLLRRSRGATVAAALPIALAAALAAVWVAPRVRPPLAVVIDGPAPLLAAPVPRAEAFRSLDAGSGVRILEVRGEWLRVATFDGGQGWLEAERAARL
ncbi:MAG TPA: BatD family protein [Longimicrobiales bacterium]